MTAGTTAASVLASVLVWTQAAAAPVGPPELSDTWVPGVPAPMSADLASTSVFDAGDPVTPMETPEPARLAGGKSVLVTGEVVGRNVRIGDSPVSVQVLRAQEVSKPAVLADGALTSQLRPVVPLTLPVDEVDASPVPKGSLSVEVLSTEGSVRKFV